jgi:hypothetical protein
LKDIPSVIGYKLSEALKLIGDQVIVKIDSTITPYEDKRKERMGNEPIVVRQIVEYDEIKLTTSLFK